MAMEETGVVAVKMRVPTSETSQNVKKQMSKGDNICLKIMEFIVYLIFQFFA